jgi:hypothetical protein
MKHPILVQLRVAGADERKLEASKFGRAAAMPSQNRSQRGQYQTRGQVEFVSNGRHFRRVIGAEHARGTAPCPML